MDAKGEKLREIMHETIEKHNGNMTCKEVVQASQNLDQYINIYNSKNN